MNKLLHLTPSKYSFIIHLLLEALFVICAELQAVCMFI